MEANREIRIREIHRKRMKAWDIQPDAEYEDEIVQRCIGVLERGDDPPHSILEHAFEIGMCTECDASAILEEVWE